MLPFIRCVCRNLEIVGICTKKDFVSADDLVYIRPHLFMYMQKEEDDRDFDLANTEPDAPLPLTVTSRVHLFMSSFLSSVLLLSLLFIFFFIFFLFCPLQFYSEKIDTEIENKKKGFGLRCWEMQVLYMLGDITAGPAYRFAQWLELVRKRSSKYRASGFPHRPHHTESMPVRLVYALMFLMFHHNVAMGDLLIEICVLKNSLDKCDLLVLMY